MSRKTTLGLIVGNRGFFPDHLCDEGRREMLLVLEQRGFGVVCLTPDDTPFGSVETREHARKCADLFKRHADEIDGIIVALPNFGYERAVADSIRMSGLEVPVLMQAFPDCGKMSACNNLKQYGIPYSLTTLHTETPSSSEFAADLECFLGVCRVVQGLRNLRVGAVGARPAAFNTVRFSEKLLEAAGISVEPVDLSEILGRINRLADDHPAVKGKLAAIGAYAPTGAIPMASTLRMAKLGAVIDEWMAETEVTISALQCWTAIEEFYGIVPCTVMSMMSDELKSSACEVDILGAIAMHALRLASGTPSALLDWNNNYGADPDKAVCFHCSNLPKHFFADVQMDYQAIIAGTVGKENTFGTVVGRVKAEPFTYCRVSTDDYNGLISAYVGEGELTNDPLSTFGGFGVARIPDLQTLLRYICENGFEHHAAINLSQCADAVEEALGKYLEWDVYRHS